MDDMLINDEHRWELISRLKRKSKSKGAVSNEDMLEVLLEILQLVSGQYSHD